MMLGERIRSLRKEKKMTQQDLADHLKLAKSTISQYENNINEPDNDTTNRIADFFNVTVDYLLGRTNNPERALSEETRDFVDSLELSDAEILTKFKFMVDGKPLTEEQAKRFVALVRAERAMQEEQK